MRVRPVGDSALLIECRNGDEAEAWSAELWRRRAAGELTVTDIVPGARTVLLDGVSPEVADLLTSWPSPYLSTLVPGLAAARASGPAAAPGPAPAPASGPASGPALGPASAPGPAPGSASAPALASAFTSPSTAAFGLSRPAEVVISVVFDGEDLVDVAALWGLDVPGVVERLTSTGFRVAFCGFAPGFGYLRGLSEEWSVPRLAAPRPRVPAGSVGLAGAYAGIYPAESPGGWRLVGRTDEVLFDVRREPPALLTPGTRVRLVARPVPNSVTPHPATSPQVEPPTVTDQAFEDRSGPGRSA